MKRKRNSVGLNYKKCTPLYQNRQKYQAICGVQHLSTVDAAHYISQVVTVNYGMKTVAYYCYQWQVIHSYLNHLYSQAVAVMRNTNLRCTWKYHRQSRQKHRPPQQLPFSQTVQRLTDKVRHLNQSLHDHLVSKRFQIWTTFKLISHHIHGRTYFVTLNGTILTDLSSSYLNAELFFWFLGCKYEKVLINWGIHGFGSWI